MSEFIFTKENNNFIVNTNFNNENVVKLQGIKPNFFYDNLTNNNHIELNQNNEAVAPFFDKLSTLIKNFKSSTKDAEIFLGLFFVTLDNPNGKVTKAPLLIVPIKVLELENKFKLSINTDLEIVTNPFLSKYLSLDTKETDFSNYSSLTDYIDKVSEICINKDFLLKNLSIMGLCEPSSNILNSKAELFESFEENEEKEIPEIKNQTLDFNENLSSFLGNDIDKEKNIENEHSELNTIQKNHSFNEVLPTDNEPTVENTPAINSVTQKFDIAKVTSKQKDAQLSTLQINTLTKDEKNIFFSSRMGQNLNILRTQKANTLPLISNIILTTLADNKKVLYLTNNKTLIGNLHNQIKKDGYEDFALFVNNGLLTNDSENLFNYAKKDITFGQEEHLKLIDKKNNLKVELNEYLKNTHKVFQNMNLTLFDVVKKIISLKKEFNIEKTYDIKIDNIIDFTPLDLHRYTFHLNNYVKYFSASKVQLESTFWNKIDFSMVQKSDFSKIESTIDELRTIVEHLNIEENSIISSSTGYKPSEIKAFYNLYSNTNDSIFTTSYIYNVDHDSLIANLDKLNTLQETFNSYQKDIYNVFDENIFSSDILVLYANLEKQLDLVVKHLDQNKYLTNDDIITNITQISLETKELLNFITSLFNTADEFSEYFSLSFCNNLDEIKLLSEMFSFVLDDVKINELWFDKNERDNFVILSKKSIELQKIVSGTKDKILQDFVEDIFEIDYNSLSAQLGIVKDQQSDPVATKIFRYLRTFKKNNKHHIDFSEASQIIADVTDYANSVTKLNETLVTLSTLYNKPLTDESSFKRAIANVKLFEEMLLAFDHNIPDNIKNFLSNPSSASHILEDYKALNEALNATVFEIEDYKEILKFNKDDMITALDNIVVASDESAYIYNKILDYVKTKEDVTLSKITEATFKISELVEVQDNFENLFEITKESVPDLLTSYDINLKGICEDFVVFKKLKSLLTKFEITENNFYDFAKTIRQEILSNTQRFNYLIDEAIELFTIIFDFANNSIDICNDFEKDLEFVIKLKSDFTLAKEAYKFANSNEECKKLGLSEFLDNINDENLNSQQIINSFLVSFYTEWLKKTLDSIGLSSDDDYFKIHNKFDEYFTLSESIYNYNKANLYSSISKTLPLLTTEKSSVDEVNVLLEDIVPNKETNFKTIFSKIPNLIFEIKPCLVTNFKDISNFGIDKNIKFDLVVIDSVTSIDEQADILDNISANQVLLFHDDTKQTDKDDIINNLNLEKHKLFTVQGKFNYSLVKFLNKFYFDKQLFIPYSKNFDLDFKNIYTPSTFENNLNEVEATKTLELVQSYYSNDCNKNNRTQIVVFTKEQENLVNSMISLHESLLQFVKNNQLVVRTLINVTPSNFTNTIISIGATSYKDFITMVPNDSLATKKLVIALFSTLTNLHFVESINFISKAYDENYINSFKMLFNIVQQFINNDEIYKIELSNKRDIFAESIIDSLNQDLNLGYTHNYNLTNIYATKNSETKMLIQSDIVLNNKTDFEDIYLKHMFTKNIDNVELLNIFSYAWYLSDDYKNFIETNIDKKLNSKTELSEVNLLEDIIQSSTQSNFFNLIPYEVADMFEIEPVDDITLFVSNAISHIVSIESPIHSNLVYEKLYSLLGTSSSVINIENCVNEALNNHLVDDVYLKNNFFWSLKNTTITPRIPVNNATTRHIAHIAEEELSEIMLAIIKKSYGISLDSLVATCCTELGFTVQSLSIKNSINSVYDKLISSNKIVNVNNKLKLVL